MRSHNRDTQLSDQLQSNPTLPDDSTSEEEPDLAYAITEKECRGMIPGSNEATAIALTGQRAIANPVVKRSKPCRVKKTASSMPKGHACTQTEPQPLVTK